MNKDHLVVSLITLVSLGLFHIGEAAAEVRDKLGESQICSGTWVSRGSGCTCAVHSWIIALPPAPFAPTSRPPPPATSPEPHPLPPPATFPPRVRPSRLHPWPNASRCISRYDCHPDVLDMLKTMIHSSPSQLVAAIICHDLWSDLYRNYLDSRTYRVLILCEHCSAFNTELFHLHIKELHVNIWPHFCIWAQIYINVQIEINFHWTVPLQ